MEAAFSSTTELAGEWRRRAAVAHQPCVVVEVGVVWRRQDPIANERLLGYDIIDNLSMTVRSGSAWLSEIAACCEGMAARRRSDLTAKVSHSFLEKQYTIPLSVGLNLPKQRTKQGSTSPGAVKACGATSVFGNDNRAGRLAHSFTRATSASSTWALPPGFCRTSKKRLDRCTLLRKRRHAGTSSFSQMSCGGGHVLRVVRRACVRRRRLRLLKQIIPAHLLHLRGGRRGQDQQRDVRELLFQDVQLRQAKTTRVEGGRTRGRETLLRHLRVEAWRRCRSEGTRVGIVPVLAPWYSQGGSRSPTGRCSGPRRRRCASAGPPARNVKKRTTRQRIPLPCNRHDIPGERVIERRKATHSVHGARVRRRRVRCISVSSLALWAFSSFAKKRLLFTTFSGVQYSTRRVLFGLSRSCAWGVVFRVYPASEGAERARNRRLACVPSLARWRRLAT